MMPIVYNVNGKTAVVTGAAGGIGLGMSRAFAAAGMRVVLSDLDGDRVAASAADLRDGGHAAIGVATDVRDADAVDALAQAAIDEFGAVHVVANNAGIGLGGSAAAMSIEDWQLTIDVDLWGVINGVRTFLPLLEAQGEGHINATASVAGLVSGPMLAAYHAAKHGVVGLMDAVRAELDRAGSSVKASVLCPGPIATDIVKQSQAMALGDDEPGNAYMDDLAGVLAAGMDPVQVGDIVLDAVLHERFWILTHPEYIAHAQRRVDDMRADNPI